MLTSAAFFFATLPIADTEWWTPFGFLVGAALAVWVGARALDPRVPLRSILVALSVGMPVLRHITGGASWSEALLGGGTAIIVIDFLLILLGLVLLRQRQTETRKADALILREPAE